MTNRNLRLHKRNVCGRVMGSDSLSACHMKPQHWYGGAEDSFMREYSKEFLNFFIIDKVYLLCYSYTV